MRAQLQGFFSGSKETRHVCGAMVKRLAHAVCNVHPPKMVTSIRLGIFMFEMYEMSSRLAVYLNELSETRRGEGAGLQIYRRKISTVTEIWKATAGKN